MAQARLDQEMLMITIGYEILENIFREIPSDLDTHRAELNRSRGREPTISTTGLREA